MKGIAFYAEMPDNWRSKSACKDHWAWTRKNIKDFANRGIYHNVCAILIGTEHKCPDGSQEAISAFLYTSNSPVSFCSVSPEWLRKRTTRIDESTARKLHPELFTRLDEKESD